MNRRASSGSVWPSILLLSSCVSTGTAGVASEPDGAASAALDAGELQGSAPGEAAPADCDEGGCDASNSDDNVGEPCGSNRDCSGERSLCEASGRCVECLSDGDCDGGESACAPAGQCRRPCTQDAACEDDQRCAVDLGVCVGCLGEADCGVDGTCTALLECVCGDSSGHDCGESE